jgi:hypothetical protein
MTPTKTRNTAHALGLAISLAFTAPVAQAADFSFTGQLTDGPLVGQSFSGFFQFDSAGLTAMFSGDLLLTGFAMQLASQTYTLASADAAPVASFVDGSLVGLGYVDADSSNPALRANVSFVAGFSGFGEAYLAYTAGTSAASAGFGSYSVSAVPEPAAWALMACGLATLVAQGRRRKA